MAGYGSPPGGPVAPGFTPTPQIRFEYISEAWSLFTQQSGVWLGAAAIVLFGAMVIGLGLTLIEAAVSKTLGQDAGFIVALINFIPRLIIQFVFVVLQAGMYIIAAKQLRGEPIAIGDLFSCFDKTWSIIGAAFVAGLATLAGFCACGVGYFVVGGLLMFTIPLVAEGGLPAMAAINESWALLKKDWLMATLLYLCILVIMFMGLCACVVGMCVTMPLFVLTVMLHYRDYTGSGGPPQYGYVPGGFTPPAPGGTATPAPPAPGWSTTPPPPAAQSGVGGPVAPPAGWGAPPPAYTPPTPAPLGGSDPSPAPPPPAPESTPERPPGPQPEPPEPMLHPAEHPEEPVHHPAPPADEGYKPPQV